MRTMRTFVALAVPDSLGSKLTRLQSLLAPDVADVRWSVVSPFHVTLAFLGDVEETDLNDVCRAVADASADFLPFELRLEGLGAFPGPIQTRTLWVGLSGPGRETLPDLHRAIAARVAEAGYPADESEFQPHVTLGRLKRGKRPSADLTPILNHYRTWSAGSFVASEAVTFASTLTPDGPQYAVLARAPLMPGKPNSQP